MKKLFTFIFALACLSMNARDLYLVGDATPADWELGWLSTTKMTEVSTGVYEWTGVLFTGTGEGFKILTQTDWNPGIHPSTGGLTIDTAGSDEVALPYSSGTDSKWTVSATAEYKIRVTFRKEGDEEKDVLVECEKVSDVVVNGYLQVSSADLLLNYARKIVKGRIVGDAYNIALTQDIDLSSVVNWTPIGTDTRKFIATFDGQGHKIKNMTIDGSKDQQGFFGVIGAGAYIKNLIMDASCTVTSSGGDRLGAFAGCCNNDGTITFENCGNEANVTGYSEKQNNAGFLGCNFGGTKLIFNNCYNKGNISGGKENGAFCGWTGGGATFNNCYNIGTVTEGETWARGNKSMNNCYQTVGTDEGVTKVTDEQVASGELCYKLNGSQSSIAWYQNLTGDAIDAIPVPFSTHAQVYANGELKCDGTSAGGELVYSNSSTSVIPPHTYNNGFCSVCNAYQENALSATDGWYEISQPWQLCWMAVSVNEHNSTYGNANIKLTDDIDYTEYKNGNIAAIGLTESFPFKGEFDGQNHTITVDLTSYSTRFSLFGTIDVNSKVHNLKVAGKITATDKNQTGGLCGLLKDGAKIYNCLVATEIVDAQSGDGTIGGICAVASGSSTIENCAFYGKINASGRSGNGGIVAWASNGVSCTIKNCLVVADITWGGGENFGRNNPTVVNTYKTTASDETLANGQMTYKLNSNVSGAEDWFQTLNTDAMPTPLSSSSKLYANGTFYCDGVTSKGGDIVLSNINESIIDPHVFGTNGVCTGCHAVGQEAALVDGKYQINNEGNLLWWGAYVNAGHTDVNAVLNAKLDMTGTVYTPIGTPENTYVGSFYGQNYSVTFALDNTPYNYQGLFGVVTDGVLIEKVIVKGFIKGNNYVGGIVGGSKGGTEGKTLNIINCGNEATITAAEANGAGIIGVNMSGAAHFFISNCYNVGNVTSGREAGAITGWTGGDRSTIENTYNIGVVTTCDGDGFVRGGGKLVNTYTLSASDTQVTSGELCYKLGTAFSQLIGTDAYPAFGSAPVSYVGDAGYATLYDTTTGYGLNGDVKAYAAVLNNTWLDLSEIGNEVPAGNAVVLKGTYYNKLAADLPAINIANDLKGTDVDTAADGTMYILANGADGVGFYKAEGTIPAGKAYFQSTSGVKAFFFDGDDATGISGVDANLNANDAIYNIAGQRVQKMQKGINIINGKKVLF